MMIVKQDKDSFHVFDVLGEMGIWELDSSGLEKYLCALERRRAEKNTAVNRFPLLENSVGMSGTEKSGGDGDDIFDHGLPESCFFDTSMVRENARKFQTGIISPPSVSIEVNTVCNYSCRWCCADVHKDEKKLTLSLQDIEERIVRPMAQAGNLTWYLAGGEPALTAERTTAIAKMIGRHCAVSSAHAPLIALDSNGTFFAQYAALFKESGINTIQFSLSSPDAAKDRYFRRCPAGQNPVQTVADGIKAAKKLGMHCGINMVLWKEDETRQNLNDVQAMIRFGNELEADFIRITPAVPGTVSEQHGMRMGKADLQEVSLQLGGMQLNRQGSIKTKVVSVLMPPDESADEMTDRPMMCRGGTCFVHVDHKGEIFPCIMVMPDFSLGNVTKNDLVQLWYDSGSFALWREPVEINTECASCSDRNYCVGKCPAYAWFNFRDLSLAAKPSACPFRSNS
jgi:radical SAM protein with 4Fe4S-binding SPASM domain